MENNKKMSSEEIFALLFTQERFFNGANIPHFLRLFAPETVQQLSQNIQDRALMHGAKLLTTVSPAVRPTFDLPFLPGNKVGKDHPVCHALYCRRMQRGDKKCPYAEEMSRGLSRCACFSENGECTCLSVQATGEDKDYDDAVISGINRTVWGNAGFEDVESSVRFAVNEDSSKIVINPLLRSMGSRMFIFPNTVRGNPRTRATIAAETATYSKFCITALIERMRSRLEPLHYELYVTAQNAALLYNAGGAPFGKAGELVIRKWCRKICAYFADRLEAECVVDLCSFNNHAQTLRLVHSIKKLNLTLSQLASLIHEPITPQQLRLKGVSAERTANAAGVFLTEEGVLRRIRSSGITFNRHPLSVLLESCHELTSVFAVIDDAYYGKIMHEFEIIDLFEKMIMFLRNNACNSTCDFCSSVCTCANGVRIVEVEEDGKKEYRVVNACTTCSKSDTCTKKDLKDAGLSGEHSSAGCFFQEVDLDVVLSDSIKHSYCKGKQDSFGTLHLVHGLNPISVGEMMKELGAVEILAIMRECISGYYINEVVENICAEDEKFFRNGSLNITHYGNDAHKAVDFLRRFIDSDILTVPEIENELLAGSTAMEFILKKYESLLSLSCRAFTEMAENSVGDPFNLMLLRRISPEILNVYKEKDRSVPKEEFYLRVRMIIDHITSMSEHEVREERRLLSGI